MSEAACAEDTLAQVREQASELRPLLRVHEPARGEPAHHGRGVVARPSPRRSARRRSGFRAAAGEAERELARSARFPADEGSDGPSLFPDERASRPLRPASRALRGPPALTRRRGRPTAADRALARRSPFPARRRAARVATRRRERPIVARGRARRRARPPSPAGEAFSAVAGPAKDAIGPPPTGAEPPAEGGPRRLPRRLPRRPRPRRRFGAGRRPARGRASQPAMRLQRAWRARAPVPLGAEPRRGGDLTRTKERASSAPALARFSAAVARLHTLAFDDYARELQNESLRDLARDMLRSVPRTAVISRCPPRLRSTRLFLAAVLVALHPESRSAERREARARRPGAPRPPRAAGPTRARARRRVEAAAEHGGAGSACDREGVRAPPRGAADPVAWHAPCASSTFAAARSCRRSCRGGAATCRSCWNGSRRRT